MKLVFCLNDIEGGVLSVVRNIIKYADLGKCSKIILCANLSSTNNSTRIKDIPEIKNTHIYRFEYSNTENFYCVAKNFKRRITKDDVIIANDWLELGVASNLGLKNKLAFILHGDYSYYYDLAIKNKVAIDKFICVSNYIREQLKKQLPDRHHDIVHLSHAIPAVICKKKFNTDQPLKCLFIGRMTVDKGYDLLPKINRLLIQKNIKVHWYIVGDKVNEDEKFVWDNNNVSFLGNIPNHLLLQKLTEYDLFVLPTKAEGFPVSLVECMKAGIVPLITDLPSGIPELVENGVNGFLFPIGDVEAYVDKIELLEKNRKLLQQFGELCAKKARIMFNPDKNGKLYLQQFDEVNKLAYKNKPKHKVYGSRLDTPLIPNFIVKIIRSKN